MLLRSGEAYFTTVVVKDEGIDFLDSDEKWNIVVKKCNNDIMFYLLVLVKLKEDRYVTSERKVIIATAMLNDIIVYLGLSHVRNNSFYKMLQQWSKGLDSKYRLYVNTIYI